MEGTPPKPRETRCEVCDVEVGSAEAAWRQHTKGKRHQSRKAAQEKLEREASVSVYVTRFAPGPDAAAALRDALSEFGPIKKIVVDPAKVGHPSL